MSDLSRPPQSAAERSTFDRFRMTGLYIVFVLLVALVYASATVGADSDKPAYELYFFYLQNNLGVPIGFDRVEPGFRLFTWLIAKLGGSTYLYFFLIFALELFGLTFQGGKRSRLFQDRFFLLVLWLGFPFFYSLSVNAVRQGLALIFVVYALDAELVGRRLRSGILIAAGALFHISTAIYLPLFILLRRHLKFRTLLIFWIVCVTCAALSVPQHLVQFATTFVPQSVRDQFPYYFSYLTGTLTTEYDTGFKFRFLLFSAIPLFALLASKPFGFWPSRECMFVLRIYLILNGMFFLIGYIPFSDRIALLSWQLIPILGAGLTPPPLRNYVSCVAILMAALAFAYFFVF